MQNRIAEIRGKLITQEELAKKVKISRVHLSAIETGGSEPGGEIMIRIARALDLPVEEIFFASPVNPAEQSTTKTA